MNLIFDSEWWHYNLKSGLQDKVSNEKCCVINKLFNAL
jgi:hypothetical protein